MSTPARRDRLASAIALAFAAQLAPLAHAATCTVNSTSDDPDDASAKVTSVDAAGWSGVNHAIVTLRDCIVAANLMTGSGGRPTDQNGAYAAAIPAQPAMTIDLGAIAGSTVTLGSALPLLFNNTLIDGGAGAPVTIDGNGKRILFVSGLPDSTEDFSGTGLPNSDGAQAIGVTLRNLVLQNASAVGAGGSSGGGGLGAGAAIFVNQKAAVRLINVDLAGNTANGGQGDLSYTGTTIRPGGGGMGGYGRYLSGGGLGGNGGVFGGGGIGTSSETRAGGGFGGNAIGQTGVTQDFASPQFNGATTLAQSGGIGGGGYWHDGSAITADSAGYGGFGAGGGGVDCEADAQRALHGGNGGFGGGGGGCRAAADSQSFALFGGDGGFGGGGGSCNVGFGGNGGFGAGGGGGKIVNFIGIPTGGDGGVGAGSGAFVAAVGTFPGGGGAAFGGALFARGGASVTIANDPARTESVAGNSVAGGNGYTPGTGAGRGLFLMSGATTTFDIGGTLTLVDNIADDSAVTLPGIAVNSYRPGCTIGQVDGGDPTNLEQDFVCGASIAKTGNGLLVLAAPDNSYAGITSVYDGNLRVTGSIAASPVVVASTGTLSGDGTTGAITSAGTVAVGTTDDPFGTLSAPSITLQTGSVTCLRAENVPIDIAFHSGRLVIGATAQLQGIVRLDFASVPAPFTPYLLVSAGGGISGSFVAVESSPPVRGSLTYTSTGVFFTTTGDDAVFGDGFEHGSAAERCAAAYVP